MPLLEKAKIAIEELQSFWPLSVRQIHYRLLNYSDVFVSVFKNGTKTEYKNDKKSYRALVDVLKRARYHGRLSLDCIDDVTRPRFVRRGFRNVADFIEFEMRTFLVGYHHDRQLEQPRHIEVLGEKNTLVQILKPICSEYYVPLTIARGYGSIPPWRDMAKRFGRSRKKDFTLIIASDYDPEGLDLADDAIRSLDCLFDIQVDYHRVGVTRDQINQLGLADDPNPVKDSSARYDSFVRRTGGKETWELEALDPMYLRDQLRATIQANMDMELYRQTVEQEKADAETLLEERHKIADALGI